MTLNHMWKKLFSYKLIPLWCFIVLVASNTLAAEGMLKKFRTHGDIKQAHITTKMIVYAFLAQLLVTDTCFLLAIFSHVKN